MAPVRSANMPLRRQPVLRLSLRQRPAKILRFAQDDWPPPHPTNTRLVSACLIYETQAVLRLRSQWRPSKILRLAQDQVTATASGVS
jgi:hypothetical protein